MNLESTKYPDIENASTNNSIQERNTSETTDFYNRTEWIVSQSILSPLYIWFIFIFVSMFKYGRRTGRFNRGCKKSFQLFFITSFAVVSGVFPRLFAIEAFLFFGASQQNHLICVVLAYSWYICYGAMLFLVYFTLWIRQRTQYTSNVGVLMPKWVRNISLLSIGLVAFSCMYLVTVHTIFFPFDPEASSCQDNLDMDIFGYVFAVEGVLLPSSQLILLFLFVYPLVQQIRKNKKNVKTMRKKINSGANEVRMTTVCDSVAESTVTEMIENEKVVPKKSKESIRSRRAKSDKNVLEHVAKRSAYLAAVCVLSDISMYMVNGIMGKVMHELGLYPFLVIYDCNMFVNTLSLVLMLKDWKIILLPWKC